MTETPKPISLIEKVTAVLINHRMNVRPNDVLCECRQFKTERGPGASLNIARHQATALISAGLMDHESEPNPEPEELSLCPYREESSAPSDYGHMHVCKRPSGHEGMHHCQGVVTFHKNETGDVWYF